MRATYVRATCYQKNISCPQHKRHARFVGGDCVLREGSRHHPQRLVITAARTLNTRTGVCMPELLWVMMRANGGATLAFKTAKNRSRLAPSVVCGHCAHGRCRRSRGNRQCTHCKRHRSQLHLTSSNQTQDAFLFSFLSPFSMTTGRLKTDARQSDARGQEAVDRRLPNHHTVC